MQRTNEWKSMWKCGCPWLTICGFAYLLHGPFRHLAYVETREDDRKSLTTVRCNYLLRPLDDEEIERTDRETERPSTAEYSIGFTRHHSNCGAGSESNSQVIEIALRKVTVGRKVDRWRDAGLFFALFDDIQTDGLPHSSVIVQNVQLYTVQFDTHVMHSRFTIWRFGAAFSTHRPRKTPKLSITHTHTP
jgi:hypothetical protein